MNSRWRRRGCFEDEADLQGRTTNWRFEEVNDERVYAIEDGAAIPLSQVNLADAGLKEREDLQEWVLARPEILGPEVIVVAFEFDRWQDARGERQRDRLDVLGLGSDGRLVLAELKRDKAPDTVEMQAIKYAAMASRFTESDLVRYHARFLSARGGATVSEDDARRALLDHTDALDPDQLRQPRIVLVAGAFMPSTSATAVWLSEMGLDITLQRVQAYRTNEAKVIVTVSQLFPVPDVEEFTISPQRAEAAATQTRHRGKRDYSTVVKLARAGTIPDGTVLTMRPVHVDAEAQEAILEWIDEDPRRGRAVWSNDARRPLRWEYDGQDYRPSAIVQVALREGAGTERSARGPAWWFTSDGHSLTDLASDEATGGFDWSGLHRILDAMPSGRWTTYGDLADLIGTAAQPLGGHVAACVDCVNAYRVLDSNGRTSVGFRWADEAKQKSQRHVLEGEGIVFAGDRADQGKRLSRAELRRLIGEADN